MTSNANSNKFDVIVAGAGPAGSIAALVLARSGARVLMVDRARFPRDKLCGDTVNPGALAILRRLGVDGAADASLPVDGMIVTGHPGVRVEARYGPGVQGRALTRRALDAALLRAASQAGAQVEEGVLVRAPICEGPRVAGLLLAGSDGRPRKVGASMVIAADGASSRIARALGLAHHARRPRRWAVGAYFEGVAAESVEGVLGEMHVRRGRYIGVAPLPGGLTNACVVTADRAALLDPLHLLQETLRSDPRLADRFASARAATRPVCLGPLAVESSTCGVPGLLLAGDAAGFIDPMTGDGLRFAFRGGELAALAALSALEHGTDASDWLRRARRQEFAPKWRFNRAVRTLVSHPAAVRAAAIGASWSPGLLQHAILYAGDVGRA
jgi:geranylgeranyl reductase family protein